ncbi:GNAT family N-acetyltransferase [Pseudoalteromonas shioyasakiensis]|uniref:GNAT family N-acetyltransferase n=1 Tax=Pseudoalteromonas shioyasakiensis TaxID=1190813 RepID=UPI002118D0EB|nr:GNAT family N-acetyltransferase [Pseudoalteromonas shioyasakiensis]MCQ8877476.1 GNAT family N-acetyltransferase [Pseudoalteromonas shioyasakiensis]
MLRLRDFKPKDQALLINYLNNPDVKRYLSPKIPSPYTVDDARWWVETGSKAGGIFAIEKDGLFIGCVSAIAGELEYCKSAEVGYWLAKEYWGQGIVTAALALLIAQVQATTDIVRLHAVVFEGNTGSSKVLLKSGFKHEALLEKAIYKEDCFYNANLYGQLISK